jgi:hypothetical protein
MVLYLRKNDFCLRFLCYFLSAFLDLFSEVCNLLGGEVAQLNGMSDQPRHHVGRIGKYLQPSDRAYLTPGLLRHHILDRFNKFGRSKERIVAFGHGSRSGVVSETTDLCVVTVDGNDSFDYPDRNIGLIQDAALLDVQFEVATNCAGKKSRFRQPLWITPKLANAISHRDSVIYASEITRLQGPGYTATAGEALFLV